MASGVYELHRCLEAVRLGTGCAAGAPQSTYKASVTHGRKSMNKLRIFPFLFLLFPLFATTTMAQGFPWDDFKPHTLAEIVKIDEREINDSVKQNRLIFHGDMFLSVVRVKYTGKRRAMSDTKKEVLKMWGQSFSIPHAEEYAAMYEEDMLFTENGVEYWLPVQKQVLPYFAKELKEGEDVNIYIVRAGGICSKKVCDWLFLVEEFQKPKEGVPGKGNA
jgi:hypothetical protein